MARLIDADEVDYENISCSQSQLHWLHRIIEIQPTVDAVEVVRCRDCKRCFKHTTKRNRQYMWICMRNDTDLYVRPDDFCSYGERKDGDGNG